LLGIALGLRYPKREALSNLKFKERDNVRATHTKGIQNSSAWVVKKMVKVA
jgi:hypothetical protein